MRASPSAPVAQSNLPACRSSPREFLTSVNSDGRSTYPLEEGAIVWDTLFQAGQDHGLVAVGIGVYATTGRLEKGYRAFGNELTGDYNLVEAGMTRPTVKKEHFVGRDAYSRSANRNQ